MTDTSNIKNIYKLSPIQLGILFESVFCSINETKKYIVQNIYKISGKLDCNNWEYAWKEIINNHDALKASFLWDNLSEPVQIIHNEVNLNWQYKNLENYPVDKNNLLTEFSDSEFDNGFDLSKPPLMRFKLLKISEDKHYFIWTIHHIIVDGWSISLIFDKVLEKYITSNAQYEAKYIQNYNNQYGDYITWLNNQNEEIALQYWRNQLSAASVTKISQFNNGLDGEFYFKLSSISTNQIKFLAKKYSVTQNIILNFVWGIILSKLTGQDDVVFGVVISGRQIDLEEVENIVGIFINILPLRISLKGKMDIFEVINNIKDSMLEGQNYGYLPLSKIQSVLDEPIQNLFDNIIIFENYPEVNELSSEFRIKLLKNKETNSYPLTITVIPGDEYEFKLAYQGNKINQKLLHNFGKLFENVIKKISKDSIKIGDIDLLSQEIKELQQINKTNFRFDQSKNLIDLFNKILSEKTDSVAIKYGNLHLSYSFIDNKSSELASFLSNNSEYFSSNIMSTILPRSPELIITMIAAQKLAATLLMIDPESPPKKIKYQIYDSKSKIIIKTKVQKLDYIKNIITLDFEDIFDSSRKIYPNFLNKSIAYIVYTSGSTGNPKGVCLSNSNLLNRICWFDRNFDFDEYDVSLQKTSQSFVDFICEIWTPLLNGVKNIIISNDELININELKLISDRENISLITAVPSLFKALIDSDVEFNFRRVILSGEKCSISLINTISEKYSTEVYNFYGSSEVMGDVIFCDYRYVDFEHENVSLIGKPIDNTKCYILDNYLNPLPKGIVGELYVSGESISYGYINKPDLTAEKFIPNPFEENSILFKSGDLCKINPDGNIEYIARKDNQFKINGFRIDPEEIEYNLKNIEYIKDAIVIYKNNLLIAYIISYKNKLNFTEIKDHLSEHLPKYMIPAIYIKIDKIPKLPSKKIDYNSLPEYKNYIKRAYIKPQDKIEIELAEIFKNVLNKDLIGTEDNFFNLGGNSILAIKLASRIRKKYKLDIKIAEIFKYPSINKLKKLIILGNKESNYSENKYKQRETSVAPLSFPQQSIWFVEKLVVNSVIYNMSVSLSIKGEIDSKLLKDSLKKIVKRHKILRTVFLEDDNGNPYQRILDEVQFYEEIDLSDKTNKFDIIKEYKFAEENFKFDLSKPSLFKVKLLSISDVEHLLIITMHHIIADDRSLEIILNELNDIYSSKINKTNLSIKKPELQYIDYSIWQRKNLLETYLNNQVIYWKEKLKNIPAISTIEPDLLQTQSLDYEGSHYLLNIEKYIGERLREISSNYAVSLHMIFLAVINVLIYKFSSQKDVVLGSPLSTRNDVELENMVGFFVNSLITRSELKGRRSFSKLVYEIKKQVIDAQNNSDIPFEMIVDKLGIERKKNKNPIFQVRVVTTENSDSKLKLADLDVEFLPLVVEQSKFDLLFRFFITSNNSIFLRIEYLSSLYSQQKIEYIGNYLNRILVSVTDDFHINICDINRIVPPIFPYGYFIKYNKIVKSTSILKTYLEIVKNFPDRIAIFHERNHISYEEFNILSDVIASKIVEFGEGLIAIYMPRTIDLIIACLAAIKARCPFLLINPNDPEERKKYLLSNSGAFLFIPNLKEENWQLLDSNSSNLTNHFTYMVYTSGSSGAPKGVEVGGEGLMSYVLEVGSRLFEERVDVIKTTPSYYNVLDDRGTGDVRGTEDISVRVLDGVKFILGGESLPWSYIKEGRRIINHYGPTEATIGCVVNLLDKEDDREFAKREDVDSRGLVVPIGSAIGGMRVYILDEDMNIVPNGGKGEIYICGYGVALSYKGDAVLTSEKFIANPFRSKEEAGLGINSRLYRSGDMGRYNAVSGNIEFIGRKDDQIKIRGYRVEKGEIESVLGNHGDVKECVVKNFGDKLVAYIVAGEFGVSEEELKVYIRKYLPDYMHPMSYVMLESLPLAGSGKVDKKLLLEPKEYDKSGNIEKEYYRDRIEENFFSIGGHSLSAIKVIARMRKIFRREFKVIEIFDNPTIREIRDRYRDSLEDLEVREVEDRDGKEGKAGERVTSNREDRA